LLIFVTHPKEEDAQIREVTCSTCIRPACLPLLRRALIRRAVRRFQPPALRTCPTHVARLKRQTRPFSLPLCRLTTLVPTRRSGRRTASLIRKVRAAFPCFPRPSFPCDTSIALGPTPAGKPGFASAAEPIYQPSPAACPRLLPVRMTM
jgi:hypothetical protein